MNYSLKHFKTGRDVSTPAKRALWDLIVKRTFGGWECVTNTFETRQSEGTWLSYKINGMTSYLDELTGSDYGKNNPELERIAGTLARQFKVKFPEIKFLMSGVPYYYEAPSFNTIDKVLSTSYVKQTKGKKNIEYSKVYSILSNIHSQQLNESELEFISKQLIS